MPTKGSTAALALLLLACSARASDRDLAHEALALCHEASLVARATARSLVEAGLVTATRAVREHPGNPVGHFATFCNLAKRMQLDGPGLRALPALRHARRALDRALELDPDYPDALAAKGALLYYLPRFAGGDVDTAEMLIRRVLSRRPDSPVRLVLVDLLTYRRSVRAAHREAMRWRSAIDATHDRADHAASRALLEHLCTQALPRPVEDVVRERC